MTLEKKIKKLKKVLLFDEECSKNSEIDEDQEDNQTKNNEKEQDEPSYEESEDFGEKIGAIQFGSVLPNMDCNTIMIFLKSLQEKPNQSSGFNGDVEDNW
ncbi:hypothetical protein U1Q18_025381 [Sarracenia purpurea var. burkii]